jgi:hypothetical protein
MEEESNETKINIENNKNLKNQLKLVSNQIEEALNRHKSKILDNATNNNNFIEYDLQKSTEFKHKIDEYKKQINHLNYELQNNRNYVTAIQNENEIKDIKNKLIEKKKEYDTLMSIKKNQEKGIKELNGRYSNKAEIAGLYQKCKNLKEEIKIKKDYNKKLINELKEKNKEIIELNDNCKFIKENIEYKKTAEKIDDNIDKEIEDLQIKIKQNKNLLKNQEKNYLNNLTKQNNKMIKLDEDINIIKVQIRHKKQEQKINLLKIKELEKLYLEIKQKEKQKKEEERYYYYNNNNFSKSQNIPNNYDENYYDQEEINDNYNINNNINNTDVNNNINNDYYYRNNILNAESQKVSSRKIPFVIGKFNSAKNVNQSYTNLNQPYSDFSSAHNNSHNTQSEKIRDPVFKEIENLKLDIKNALLENNNDISNIEHLNNSNNLLDEINNNNENNENDNKEFYNEEVNEEVINDDENELKNEKSFVQFSYEEEQEG